MAEEIEHQQDTKGHHKTQILNEVNDKCFNGIESNHNTNALAGLNSSDGPRVNTTTITTGVKHSA